jgi:hypothetical protein
VFSFEQHDLRVIRRRTRTGFRLGISGPDFGGRRDDLEPIFGFSRFFLEKNPLF